mmetsp:Transcript_98733/g.318412  ORF Transcript_98733/g.318412 Transcript_98733/m.318412 type:complete len:267 (+) Transcript_98733:460-1260(+)
MKASARGLTHRVRRLNKRAPVTRAATASHRSAGGRLGRRTIAGGGPGGRVGVQPGAAVLRTTRRRSVKARTAARTSWPPGSHRRRGSRAAGAAGRAADAAAASCGAASTGEAGRAARACKGRTRGAPAEGSSAAGTQIEAPRSCGKPLAAAAAALPAAGVRHPGVRTRVARARAKAIATPRCAFPTFLASVSGETVAGSDTRTPKTPSWPKRASRTRYAGSAWTVSARTVCSGTRMAGGVTSPEPTMPGCSALWRWCGEQGIWPHV